LRRAIENVLRNAVRHSPARSTIQIKLAMENQQIRFSVRDQGVGVPEESLSRLFEPFFRGDTERSPDACGFGLGLTIVKRSIEAHGGTVSASNIAEGGLEIAICLPFMSCAQKAPPLDTS